jgi:hypothetical protein
MRRRLEVIAAVLAVGGAALAVQQAFSVPGDLLPAGVYLAIAGAVLLVVASGRPDRSRLTWGARIVTGLAVGVAVSFGLLAVHLCGPTVLLFDCRA